MSRGRKLKKEGNGAVKKLRQSSLVERIKICKNWIAVWFETGIIEKWTFETPPDAIDYDALKIPKYKRIKFPKYRQLPSNQSEWSGEEIQILDEDPIGLEAIFEDNNGGITSNFFVKYQDLAKGGFFDKRLLVHKITYKVLCDGWVKPNFKIDVLKKDWEILKKAYKPQKSPRSIIIATSTKKICGYSVWSHFFDLGAYEEKRKPLRECYDHPKIIITAIEALIKQKKKITRTNLLYSILKKSFSISRSCYGFNVFGPYEFRPNVYRDIFTRIFKIKNPIILDYNPDLGSKAIASVLCDGVYIYKDCGVMKWADKFAEFSGGKLIKDDEKKTADIAIIGAMGCFAKPEKAIKLLPEARKRSACTLVFCRIGKEEEEILQYAPTTHIIKIMFGLINMGKILVYKN